MPVRPSSKPSVRKAPPAGRRGAERGAHPVGGAAGLHRAWPWPRHAPIVGTIDAFQILLPTGLRPDIQSVTTEGDRVVVEFEGNALTSECKPYRKQCCMVLTLRGGRIHKGHEYFCMTLADEVLWPLLENMQLPAAPQAVDRAAGMSGIRKSCSGRRIAAASSIREDGRKRLLRRSASNGRVSGGAGEFQACRHARCFAAVGGAGAGCPGPVAVRLFR